MSVEVIVNEDVVGIQSNKQIEKRFDVRNQQKYEQIRGRRRNTGKKQIDSNAMNFGW